MFMLINAMLTTTQTSNFDKQKVFFEKNYMFCFVFFRFSFIIRKVSDTTFPQKAVAIPMLALKFNKLEKIYEKISNFG